MIQNKNKSTFIELLKFGFAGGLNTLIDFAVLNILIYIFGLGQNSSHYTIFKIISFSASVTNSYFLNKYWVFKNNSEINQSQNEIMKFLGVSLVGLVLNTGVSFLIFHYGSPFINVGAKTLANIGAIVGTLTVLFWNFIGYKLFVFKKDPPEIKTIKY